MQAFHVPVTVVTGMPDAFYLAQMRPFGIPMPVLFMVVLAVVASLWMRYRTRLSCRRCAGFPDISTPSCPRRAQGSLSPTTT